MKKLSNSARARRVCANKLCLLAPLFLFPCTASAGQLTVLALSGDPVPAGDAFYEGFHQPTVNAHGEVAVSLGLANEEGTSLSGNALYIWRDGVPEEVFRSNYADPPFGILSIRTTATGIDHIAFNDRGSIAALASVSAELAPGVTFPQGIFRFHPFEGTVRGPIPTDTVPGGGATFRHTSWYRPGLNNADQIALRSYNLVSLNEFYGSLDRVEPDGSVTRLAVNGMEVPGTDAVINNILGGTDINIHGQIAFLAALNIGEDEGTTHGILIADDEGVRIVALGGDPSPDGDGVYGSAGSAGHFTPMVFNDRGQVLFRIRLLEASETRLHHAWVLEGDGVSTVVARERSPAPGNDGTFQPIGRVALNNHGLTAFIASVGGTQQRLYFGTSSGLRLLHANEDPGPGGEGRLRSFDGRVVLNDRGQTAFLGSYLFPRDPGPGFDNETLLVFRDEYGTLHEVIRLGTEISGSPVDEILLSGNVDSGGNGTASGLGEAGHLTFRVTLADDREAILLWTPPTVHGLAQVAGTDCAEAGWCELPWFGSFYQDRRWIWHDHHGWMLFGNEPSDGFDLYDVALGTWMWTRADIYPLHYARAPVDAWVWFEAEGGFFRLDNGERLDPAGSGG